jgi:hypothetical protein
MENKINWTLIANNPYELSNLAKTRADYGDVVNYYAILHESLKGGFLRLDNQEMAALSNLFCYGGESSMNVKWLEKFKKPGLEQTIGLYLLRTLEKKFIPNNIAKIVKKGNEDFFQATKLAKEAKYAAKFGGKKVGRANYGIYWIGSPEFPQEGLDYQRLNPWEN